MSLPREVADAIAATGVSRVFGIPGGGPSLELVDELERRGVPFHTTAFEGSAAIMAGLTGRLTQRAGVALAIKGPGFGNLLAGMATCRFESWPLVAISEAFAPDAPASRAHKRLAHDVAVHGIAKAFGRCSNGGFARACTIAEAETPGAVALDLVEGDPPVEVELVPPVGSGNALGLLEKAKRPVVIVGTLAIRLGLSSRLAELAIPVFTTAAAKGALDERLEHAAGVYTGVGLSLSPEVSVLPEADLVVGIGLRSTELLGHPALPILNLDPLGAAALPGIGATELTLGDLDQLIAQLGTFRWGCDIVGSSLTHMRSALNEGPFLVAGALSAAAATLPDARLVVDTGFFCTIAEHVWTATGVDDFLGSGAARSMGVGLPMAVAAALHDRGRPTICAVGDGGLPMFLAEFAIAVRERLPLAILHMNDGGFGSIRPRARSGGLTLSPLAALIASWAPIFDGFDVPVRRVRQAEELRAALDDWRPEGGPIFVECSFDPAAYERMSEELRG